MFIFGFLVICSFRGSVPQGLVLEIGETVQILEKCEGKYGPINYKTQIVIIFGSIIYVYFVVLVISNLFEAMITHIMIHCYKIISDLSSAQLMSNFGSNLIATMK